MANIKFVYEQKVSPYLSGKVIDYQDGPQGGFLISDLEAGDSCQGCC